MAKESEEWIIAQAYCGLITFILDLILLHLLIGNVQTVEHLISDKIVVYLAFSVISCSLIYCLSSSILLSDAIFGITITHSLCQFGFVWCYTWYTLQRYCTYLFFIMRIKISFKNTLFEVQSKCIYILIISITIVMISIEFSWIILYKPITATANGYNECTTYVDESDGSSDILIVSSLICMDILVAFSTLFYFISKLYALRNNRRTGCCCCMQKHSAESAEQSTPNNVPKLKNNNNSEVKRVAHQSLVFGILAIVSTMSFYFGYFIIDSIGHVLQIDSFINSFCIVAVFSWKFDEFFNRYVLWCLYVKHKKNTQNIESTQSNQQQNRSAPTNTKTVSASSEMV